MPNFDVYHPDYLRWEKRWQMFYDFSRGGIHVLNPGHVTGSVFFYVEEESAGTDPEKERTQQSRYRWTPHPSQHYLWTHERESKKRYDDRCMRAIHIPLCKPVINIFTTGVLKVGPKREDAKGIWEDIYKDVDGTGEDMDAFMRDALDFAEAFGRVHAIVDRPPADQKIVTLRDQREAGLRSYAYHVLPTDLVDWKLDRYGNFEWVVIRELMPDLTNWGERESAPEGKKQRPWQYRVWTRQEWILFVPSEKQDKPEDMYVEVARGEHPCSGYVPMVTLWNKRIDRQTLDSESLISDLVDIDQSIFNKMSLLDEIDFGQTFSQMAIPDTTKLGIQGINIGVYEAFTFDPEGGAPLYISPNAQMASGLWERIRDLFQIAREVVNASRGKAEYSKEERSGDALTIERTETNNHMARLAGSTEEFETGLLHLFGRYEGETNIPSSSYNRNFDVRSLQEKLRDALSIQRLGPGAVAMAEITKTVTGEFLKAAGKDDAVVNKVSTDIEKTAREMAEALPTYGEEKQQSGGFQQQQKQKAEKGKAK